MMGYGRTIVLGPLDLDVSAFPLVIMGPNGTGKSSFLRVLTTQRSPRRGSMEFDGLSVSSRRDVAELRRMTGYCPQDFAGVRHFTVRENLEYAAWLKRVPARAVASRVDHAIERTDLAGCVDMQAGKLSGGMLRRLGIAQSIVHRPSLLCLDEPTAGLDRAQAAKLRALVGSLAQSTIVVLVTHVVADVVALDGTLMVIKGGGASHLAPTPPGTPELRAEEVTRIYESVADSNP